MTKKEPTFRWGKGAEKVIAFNGVGFLITPEKCLLFVHKTSTRKKGSFTNKKDWIFTNFGNVVPDWKKSC